MRYLLPCGREFLYDECDENVVARFHWYRGSRGYVVAHVPNRNKEFVRLHRAIMCATAGFVVDHVNGDVLDNRRCNLRVCSSADNSRNQQKQRRESLTSRYKGVHRFRYSWRAMIGVDGRLHHIAIDDCEEHAARLYDAAAVLLFGEFSRLNFPGEPLVELPPQFVAKHLAATLTQGAAS